MSNFKYEKFIGKALLDKIEILSHLTHSERAKECGYFSIVYLEDGRRKTKLNIEEFYR
ncbi:MAG: hypothetical protein KME64_24555 [Scytonematopsis contorta HA4267-MV1]|jgi:hypothetical protein|nr:hypothetical protein [Scytonematopsis contorta HA4267-MV1]